MNTLNEMSTVEQNLDKEDPITSHNIMLSTHWD